MDWPEQFASFIEGSANHEKYWKKTFSFCLRIGAANSVAGVMAQDRRSDEKNVAVLAGAEALFLDSQS